MRRVLGLAVAGALLAVVVPITEGSRVLPGARAASSPPAATVRNFGIAKSYGSLAGPVTRPVVGFAPHPSGRGYWLVATDGGVFSFGAAGFHGSTGAIRLNQPIVGMAAHPSGRGYWLVAADGGIFSFGAAHFHGSTGAIRLNQPIVGMAAHPSGRGYWLVAADGGIFSFGAARFKGSTGNIRLNQPIVGMGAHRSGRGYWLVAADGGIFSFGTARFKGSTGNIRLNQPIVGMAPHPSGSGYWLVAADGGIFTFGAARFYGSMASSMPPNNAAVGMGSTPGGGGYWVAAVPAAIRVMMTGDVHGERQIRSLLESGGNPLDAIAHELRQADVSIVNLETPVGRGGAPQAKEFVFLAPPSLTTALRAGGVDVVTLANNHALDHGAGALLETIDHARRAGLVVVGAGRNASEAYRPALVRARGRTVAVVGLSRVVPPGWAATANSPGVASVYDEGAALNAVRTAASQSDTVVVVIHWGTELARCPDGAILGLAARLRQAGADVVAGHHPHVLQGIRVEAGALVAYSLGNFVWYHNQPPSDATGILEAMVTNGRLEAWRFVPARIDGTGRPRPAQGSDGQAIRGEVAALAPGAGRCPG